MQGGTPELQGTWMDEKLALKFAAWLSPYFELWVYDRIEELLLTGRTEILDFQPNSVILSRQKNIPTGTAHDERYGQVRTYHEEVLKEVIRYLDPQMKTILIQFDYQSIKAMPSVFDIKPE